jgi:glycosyltransferase involved in cell wall biosynthesis
MLVWENLCFARAASDDVLFCPSFSRPLLARGKTVTIVHEATLALFPQYYPMLARYLHSHLYGWSARHSTRVISPTDQAREDIVRAYGAPRDKMRVVAWAPTDLFRPLGDDPRAAKVKRRYVGGTEPFFLYVGKLTLRRNVPTLMEAFADLKRRHLLPHKLVIVGSNTANVDIFGLAARLGITQDVRYDGHAPDEDLAVLYSSAEAFVLPYTYEAVSLTVMEAQAAGTPVITTDTPGLRQTAGDAALFIPDARSESIAKAMLSIANDASLRRDLILRGVANAARYSWRRCSNEVLDVLHEAAAA